MENAHNNPGPESAVRPAEAVVSALGDDHSATPIFDVRDVHYRYLHRFEALCGVSCRVMPGEQVALLGANGSGKSTLLKLLDGLDFPNAGLIYAFGQPLTPHALEHEATAYEFRQRVGFVFQDADVQCFSPTVWDEVAFGPRQLGLAKSDLEARVDAALKALGLDPLRNRAPYQLSGGEKRKVALASVQVLAPEVWLLDEPTMGLDPRSQSHLIDFILEEKARGRTIIIASHDLAFVREVSDRALVLGEDHRVAADGPTDALLQDRPLLLAANLVADRKSR